MEATSKLSPKFMYRSAQGYVALLILFGAIATWRVLDFWGGMNMSVGRLVEGFSVVRMRDLPEFLMIALPLWMPIVMLAGGIWFYLLRKPRTWALWMTFLVAAMAVMLVLGIDDALHRIEAGYYSKSRWVDLFWQLARPVQVVSIAWLVALPAQWLLLRVRRSSTVDA